MTKSITKPYVVVMAAPQRGAMACMFEARTLKEARVQAVSRARKVEPIEWRVKSARRMRV